MDMDEASNTCSFDLYSDIIEDNFQQRESSYTELEEKFKGIQVEVCALRQQLEDATTKVHLFQEENVTLKKNISSLLKTAKCEIQRKNDEIKRLRSCIEIRWRRQQGTYLHRRSNHDLSSSQNGETCDSVTDGTSSSENIGFSKYGVWKKNGHPDDIRSGAHKTKGEHRENSIRKGEVTTGRGEKCERDLDPQKSMCLPKAVKDMVAEVGKDSSDHKTLANDSRRLVQSKSKERNCSGSHRRLNDRPFDVSRGRLDGRQVKSQRKSSEYRDRDREKDESIRKRESSKGRIPGKENVSSQENAHNSGSRKRRHQSDSSSSSKRTKIVKSPQRPPEGKTISVRKYLQASPGLPLVSEPSATLCKKKTSSRLEVDIAKKDTKGKESRTMPAVDGKQSDQTRPGSLKSLITKADSKTANRVEQAKTVSIESKVYVNASVVSLNSNNDVTEKEYGTLTHIKKDGKDDTSQANVKACETQECSTLNSCDRGVKGENNIVCQENMGCVGIKVEATDHFDMKIDNQTGGLESMKPPLRTDSTNALETKAEVKSSLALSSGSSASVSSSLYIDRGDTLRTQTNQSASNCSVISADSASCSSSEVSVESCQRTTPRRDSACTVTSTKLWESTNGITTWVQGVEYVHGVKKYRLRRLKPGETSVSSSAESLQSSSTTSPIKGYASGLTDDDSKSASLSKSVGPMDEESLTEIHQGSSLNEQVEGGPAPISPFKTPIATPSLDKLPDADQVHSTDCCAVGEEVGSSKEPSEPVKISLVSHGATDSACFTTESKADERSPESQGFIPVSKSVDQEQKSETRPVRRPSTRETDSKKSICHQSPPSSRKKQILTDSKRLTSKSQDGKVRRSRQSAVFQQECSETKDCLVILQQETALNEVSESLLSIPDDVYVFIGEENDTCETSSSSAENEPISDGHADECEKSEADKESAGNVEVVESLSDKEKKDSVNASHVMDKMNLVNGSVEESAKYSPHLSQNDVEHLSLEIDNMVGSENYLSEKSEIEDGELTSDSDNFIQQSPQGAAQKSPALHSSSGQPIVDLRQKLLTGKRVSGKPSHNSPCRDCSVGQSQSVRRKQRLSECGREGNASPASHRGRCRSTKHLSRHGHRNLPSRSSPNRHSKCVEEYKTSPDGRRPQGQIRNGPELQKSTESCHRSSSPKPNSVKDRSCQTGYSSRRSLSRVSQERDWSHCQTRSRSNSSNRSTQSHRSDSSATETCCCCNRHQERSRSPQHCEIRGPARHGGERHMSRSPSPRRTHHCREEKGERRLSPPGRYSSRHRHDYSDHSKHRSSACRPTSPTPGGHSLGRTKVSACHRRDKDKRKLACHLDKTTHHCSGHERYSTEDRVGWLPSVETREHDRNKRVKVDSHRSGKRHK